MFLLLFRIFITILNCSSACNTFDTAFCTEMNEQSLLTTRIADLERQIAMYERLFQTFSAKLDHHFKKYDLVINSQQQQINALSDVISTLLNDQYRYAGILRDKMMRTLDGVTTAPLSVSDINSTLKHRSDEDTSQGKNGSATTTDPMDYSSTNVNAILGDLMGTDPIGEDPHPNHPPKHTFVNTHMNHHSPKRNRKKDDIDVVSDSNVAYSQQEQQQTQQQQRQQEQQQQAPHLSYDLGEAHTRTQFTETGFSPLGNESVGGKSTSTDNNNNDTDAATTVNSNSTDPTASVFSQNLEADSRIAAISNRSMSPAGAASNSQRQDNNNDGGNTPGNTSIDTNVKEEQYYTHKGLKKKRKVFVGNFQFLNSPQTVLEIWKEYTEGIDGQPSLKDMEFMYQTSWRREPAVNKRFSRRKVLCKAIERGLSRGYALGDIIDLLENYRVIDQNRDLKQPIGWLCQGTNIPDVLK